MCAFCIEFPTYPWLPFVRGRQPRHWATCVLRLNCSVHSLLLSSDPQLAHVLSLSPGFSTTTPLRHHMRRNLNKVRKTEALVLVTRVCVFPSSTHCSRQRRQRKIIIKMDSVVRFVHVSLQSSSHLDFEISVLLWIFRIQDRTSQTVPG